jgi:hypothetical protein
MSGREFRAELVHDRCWDARTQAGQETILRPNRELGLGHTTMGIGIWAAARARRPWAQVFSLHSPQNNNPS